MTQIFCKILIENPKTAKVEEISGEICRDHVFSRESAFITVRNKIFLENEWKANEATVFKADIKQIILYKARRRFTFDKNSLELNSIITIGKRVLQES